ncbi:MAG: 3'-5' exonuclease [Myxococcales bacterium]
MTGRCAAAAKSFSFEDPGGLAPIHVFVTGTESSGKRRVYPRLGPAIAREIRRLVNPANPARWKGNPLGYGDVFVLGRGADDLRQVAEHLRAAGIPYAFFKQEGLFQSREALALEDLLAAVADPADRARRYRAWMTPFFELGLAEVAAAAEASDDDPLVARLWEWHRLAARRDHERLFSALLEDSGLVRRRILFEAGDRALTNFLHILEVLREQFVVRGASVEDMVKALRSWRTGARKPPGQNGNLQRLETEKRSVQLLTMHMSKGLEAPVVFVVGGLHKPAGRTGVRTLHGELVDGRRERLSLVGGGPAALGQRADAEEAEEDRRLLYVALTRAMGRLYLPFAGRSEYGSFLEPKTELSGCYAPVNARLLQLLPQLSGPPRPGAHGSPSGRPALFTHEVLSVEPQVPAVSPSPGALAAAPALWEPPKVEDLSALRARHAGFVTTSFSSLRDRVEGPAAQTKAETHDVAAPAEDDLPGGAATGSFLHEVLEELSPEVARGCASGEELLAREDGRALLGRHARRWGLSPEHLPRAADLVHTALTSPLSLGARGRIESIASADRLLREMDFLYPIPERAHPRLSQLQAPDAPSRSGRPKFEIRRGFVVGFVDLLFEHGGLVYLADWKSNCLAAFDRKHVDDEVAHSYALQGELYTLALVKMLGLHDEASFEKKFGGLFFLFLRGLKAGGDGESGVWFRRPTWAQVLSWEEKLLAMDLGPGESGAA